MGDDDEGGGLGERLSIAMAGVPVPDDDDDQSVRGARSGAARHGGARHGADLLAGLDVDDALDLLEPDADLLDEAVDEISASNPPPAFPSVSVRPAPPRAPLPVRRPSGSAPRDRDPISQDRISNEPPVAFPPPPSEPPPGRGSGIDFEKVLATASMSPPPKPEAPTLDLAMAPPAPSVPVEARSSMGRTVVLVALVAAAAFSVAWFLRAPAPETESLALGPIEGAPRVSDTDRNASSRSAEPSTEAREPGDERDGVGVAPTETGVTGESATAQAETTRVEALGSEALEETAREEPALDETTRADTTRPETTRAETTRADTTRTDTTRTDTTRTDTTRTDTTRTDTTRAETTRAETTRVDSRERDTTTTEPEREVVRVEREVAPPPPPPPPADLPDEPTRDEVQAALTAVRPAVQSCVQPGAQVRVRITIANSGRVTTAVVEDDIWSRQPHGGCIARAVRTATFPRFARDRFVVVFPFQL